MPALARNNDRAATIPDVPVERGLLISAATGATLLLVTHDTALAARCPRVMNLAAGRVSRASPLLAAAS